MKRTTSSKSDTTITAGTEQFPIEIRYAYASFRGYYPYDPFKKNQDDVAITAPFAGGPNDALFSVYDGHGQTGHDCAAFARKNLPRLSEKYIRQARVKAYREKLKQEGKLDGAKLYDPLMWPYLEPQELQDCFQKAHLDCNSDMHNSTEVRLKKLHVELLVG